MLTIILYFILIVFGLNAAFALIMFIVYQSGILGAKLSKKVGTNNQHTNKSIITGNKESKYYLKRFIITLTISAISGLVLYFNI